MFLMQIIARHQALTSPGFSNFTVLHTVSRILDTLQFK